MKQFTRIEPTTIYEVGDRFKQQVVVKRFRTDDGLEHEFTTFFREGALKITVSLASSPLLRLLAASEKVGEP